MDKTSFYEAAALLYISVWFWNFWDKDVVHFRLQHSHTLEKSVNGKLPMTNRLGEPDVYLYPSPPTRLTLAVFLCCSLVASFLFCCCWNTKDLSAVLSRPPYTTAMPLEEKDCAATYKILILGENSVGKTAILNSLVGRDFKSSVLPTSGKPFRVSFHRNTLLFER